MYVPHEGGLAEGAAAQKERSRRHFSMHNTKPASRGKKPKVEFAIVDHGRGKSKMVV